MGSPLFNRDPVLIEMQEMECPGIGPLGRTRPYHLLHKEVSLTCTLITTYPFVISKRTGMTVSQITDEIISTGLIDMQELNALGDRRL